MAQACRISMAEQGLREIREEKDRDTSHRGVCCVSFVRFPSTFPHLLTRRLSQRRKNLGKAETFQIYLGWRKFNLKWRLRYNGSLRYSATQPPFLPNSSQLCHRRSLPISLSSNKHPYSRVAIFQNTKCRSYRGGGSL